MNVARRFISCNSRSALSFSVRGGGRGGCCRGKLRPDEGSARHQSVPSSRLKLYPGLILNANSTIKKINKLTTAMKKMILQITNFIASNKKHPSLFSSLFLQNLKPANSYTRYPIIAMRRITQHTVNNVFWGAYALIILLRRWLIPFSSSSRFDILFSA